MMDWGIGSRLMYPSLEPVPAEEKKKKKEKTKQNKNPTGFIEQQLKDMI